MKRWTNIGSCQRAEKVVEHRGNGDTNNSLYIWKSSQRLGKKTDGIGNQMKNWYHLDQKYYWD